VDGSAKDADLVAPRVSLSPSGNAFKSSPLDSIAGKRPILAQLYNDDSRPTDTVHNPEPSRAANLFTVSQAEAEAVQALLDLEAHNRMITPSGSGVPRSSSLSVEAKKGPVSEDMVRFYQFTDTNIWLWGVA